MRRRRSIAGFVALYALASTAVLAQTKGSTPVLHGTATDSVAGMAGAAAGGERMAVPHSSTDAPGKFVDVTASSGIQFRHQAPHTSRKYLIETMGSGVALFDCDNDGRLD